MEAETSIRAEVVCDSVVMMVEKWYTIIKEVYGLMWLNAYTLGYGAELCGSLFTDYIRMINYIRPHFYYGECKGDYVSTVEARSGSRP